MGIKITYECDCCGMEVPESTTITINMDGERNDYYTHKELCEEHAITFKAMIDQFFRKK